MRRFVAGLLASLIASLAGAGELFDGISVGSIRNGEAVTAGDTVGGYGVYPGDGNWRFEASQVDLASGGGPIWLGQALMVHRQASTIVAWQTMVANLNRNTEAMSNWRYGPCEQSHLVTRAHRSGSLVSCLTIDANTQTAGSRASTYLGVAITNTGAYARLLRLQLGLNLEVFGFRDTTSADWAPAAVASHPRRAAFVERLTAWAETLRAAAEMTFDEDRSGAAYAAVPSYMTLMTVPDDLKDGNYSLSFLGAVEDLNNRSGFKAIAYSPIGPGRTRWATSSGQSTQDDADQRAVESCERERAASLPPCKLYPAR